jgi:hypothetical protein
MARVGRALPPGGELDPENADLTHPGVRRRMTMKPLYAFGLLAAALLPTTIAMRADTLTVAQATTPISDSLQIGVRDRMTGNTLFSDYKTSTENANDTDSPNPVVVGPLPVGVNLPRAGWVQINEPNGSLSDIVTYDFTSNSFKLYSDPYDLATLARALRTQFGAPLGTETEDPTAGVAGMYFGLSQFYNPSTIPNRRYSTTLIAVSDFDPPAPPPADEPISDEPAAIPEPGTWCLMAVGGLCLAGYGKMQQKKIGARGVEMLH